MNITKKFPKYIHHKRSFMFTNISTPKYSMNIIDEEFYLWAERSIIPFAIISDSCVALHAKEIRKILYDAINTPVSKKYQVYDLWVEIYLEKCGLPIQEVDMGKKIFRYRVRQINLMGKDKLMEYYKTNQPLFITNKE